MADEPHKSNDAEGEPRKPGVYQTTLERHPDHLKALGTISVEIVNMETVIAALFSAILFIPREMGEAIYFAPQSTGPRLKMFQRACDHIPEHYDFFSSRAKKLIKRAGKLHNTRNDLLHSAWSISEDKSSVSKRALPFSEKTSALPHGLNALKSLILAIRATSTEIIRLSEEISADDHYTPWLEKSREQFDHLPDDPIRQTPMKE